MGDSKNPWDRRVDAANARSASGFAGRWISQLDKLYRRVRSAPRLSKNASISRLYLKNRGRVRGKFHFVSACEAALWSNEWVRELPRRYDVVVGIPRSGMMVATQVALKLGCPLSTPELLAKGEWWFSENGKAPVPGERKLEIILIDDSITSGKTLDLAVEVLAACPFPIEVTTASLIVTEESKDLVDLSYRVVAHPRFFEWNILHRKASVFFGEGTSLAVMLEGVLCAGPLEALSERATPIDDAVPYLVPAFEIDHILTSRPENEREATEAWLARHRVAYRQLHMNIASADEESDSDVATEKPGKDGAELLLEIKPDMVWVSRMSRSEYLFGETHIPTLCTDEMILLS